jgi:hypothetical protein
MREIRRSQPRFAHAFNRSPCCLGGVATAWRMMSLFAGHWQLRGFGTWVVQRRADAAVLGRAGLWQPEGWPGVEVGWMFARSAWGPATIDNTTEVSHHLGVSGHARKRVQITVAPLPQDQSLGGHPWNHRLKLKARVFVFTHERGGPYPGRTTEPVSAGLAQPRAPCCQDPKGAHRQPATGSRVGQTGLELGGPATCPD